MLPLPDYSFGGPGALRATSMTRTPSIRSLFQSVVRGSDAATAHLRSHSPNPDNSFSTTSPMSVVLDDITFVLPGVGEYPEFLCSFVRWRPRPGGGGGVSGAQPRARTRLSLVFLHCASTRQYQSSVSLQGPSLRGPLPRCFSRQRDMVADGRASIRGSGTRA